MHPDDRSTTPVWVGLGSNLGDRRSILDHAVALLAVADGVTVEAASTYHETLPVGGPPGQGPFLNAAIQLRTSLDPFGLLAVAQDVENQMGRTRTVRWGERTLDVDLLIFGTMFVDAPNLKLPHPRLAFRRFVLGPLAEIAPSITDTMTKRTIADLLANLDRKPRCLTIDGAVGSVKSAVFRRLLAELPAPGIAQMEDQSQGILGLFESNAIKIHADRWFSEPDSAPWLVAESYLDDSTLYRLMVRAWKGVPEAERDDRESSDMQPFQRLRAMMAEAEAYHPTLLVALPGSMWTPRQPGQSHIPILRPESEDPEAIVAEVLATCRSIESV